MKLILIYETWGYDKLNNVYSFGLIVIPNLNKIYTSPNKGIFTLGNYKIFK
jgi:hypothetical protein